MSLTLPAHLAPQSLGRARSRANRAIGVVCLSAVLLGLRPLSQEQPQLVLWPTALAALAFLVTMLLIFTDHGVIASAAYIVVGLSTTYICASTWLTFQGSPGVVFS